MELWVQIALTVFSVFVAAAALLSSRKASRMQALMMYNSGWAEFNRETATDPLMQEAFGSLDTVDGLFSPKIRAFLYYITLTENAYILRREDLIPKKEYNRFMAFTGDFVKKSVDFDFAFLRSIGFDEDFVKALESKSTLLEAR